MLKGSMPISDEAGDGRRGVVVWSVETRRWPGERRLRGDAGRLLVADLADEDHVRVHAQVAAQRPGER